ncbi:alpha-ketoacid dehydrogenase subunit alpha/beta [Paraflavitalea sp. CAU 1676]|uniref:alpha-ketoacid dehydrogenase subunit alpha/beta n=1 Tax=Paraflavitalea sp. CAU 1676 TaxID=3032598 RepID=UPI0023DC1E39|nr:alpha-ketoacid dehydrogenase subunit alpha/beta [Paraflavitalea sp. CAU 1676]MDF2189707.1 thiamine pyrophosphate-dependent enzyme [Paraflavitalea sp. CAU 1676]
MENTIHNPLLTSEKLSFDKFREEVLRDYRLACESREVSLLGRKEVLTGKAKFGIFGDGKEVAQIAVAKFFKPGDFLSGYYRDQTLAFATGQATLEEFFSQLYADPDAANDPHSAGRQMNSHFATPNVDSNGNWLDLVNRKNIAAGMAPTAGQMPRSLGFALASTLFRHSEALQDMHELSDNGNEVCFCTIGDASTSEGHFWETVNAAGVLQVPLAVFVWDDGYGISVPRKYQTTKGSISEALKGMQKKDHTNGFDIYKLKAWDYAGMCEVLESAIQKIRNTHIPALFHVEEVTQPQGHSTSGSHERYKSPEQLEWEREWDGNKKFREWVLENELASEDELHEIEIAAKELVRDSRNHAWERYMTPIRQRVAQCVELIDSLIAQGADVHGEIEKARAELASNREPHRKDILQTLHKVISAAGDSLMIAEVKAMYATLKKEGYQSYNTYLYDESPKSPLNVKAVEPEYAHDAPIANGYEILNKYFDGLFGSNPKVLAFGEDVGKIGDVNQGFAGLQAKYGEHRIFDTAIRELTIMGQGIGLAMRGLRPIAEIQYLDYLLYGLQPLSDDAASLHWRTKGRQSCPIIVRTRGHRLEGIWHSGSPMGMMLHSLRGLHICVPRNMVQATGMYNTLLEGNDPAIVVESLNGYRLKEKMPSNLLEHRVPLGVPEIVKEGTDITVVSYGSTLRIAQEAAVVLEKEGISCEVVDVQTLLPFDIHHMILDSLKKTNRILFVDEDVPGGACGYMYNEVMEKQGGYRWLDVAPRTITAQAHRPSYGTDGDYFSKPNLEEIIDTIREMMAE